MQNFNWSSKPFIFMFFLTFFVPALLKAQNSSLFTKSVYVSGKDSLPYRLLYPENFDKRKHYPLILFLHGGGENGKDNELQLALMPKVLTDSAGRLNYPCFILAPQCPKNRLWVRFPHFPESLQTTLEPTPPAKWTFELLDMLLKQLPVDQHRIYITGYSMGGEGTFDFLTRRPNLFAAAIPLCSVSDTSKAKMIYHIPVWAFHGDQDDINDVKYSRMMIACLKNNGGKPKYTEFSGMSHNIVVKAYNESGLFKWLFLQKQK